MTDYMTTFTVAKVSPKAGPKMTAVTGTDGNTYFIYNDKMANVGPGVVIGCTYTVGESRDGKPAPYFVKAINNIQGAAPPPPPPQTVGDYLQDSLPPHQQAPQQNGGDISDLPPILSNALGHYLMNPNCRFNFETPEEFGHFVKRVQWGYANSD